MNDSMARRLAQSWPFHHHCRKCGKEIIVYKLAIGDDGYYIGGFMSNPPYTEWELDFLTLVVYIDDENYFTRIDGICPECQQQEWE